MLSISVCLLTFNRQQFVGEALLAIMGQTYKNIEILVIDNHSTDSTPKIVQDLAAQDPRVTYIRLQKGSDRPNSYDKAYLYARGDYVVVTHDDDIMDKEYIKTVAKVIVENPYVGLIASNVQIIDEINNIKLKKLYAIEEDLVIPKCHFPRLYFERRFWLPTTSHCFRRDAALKIYGPQRLAFIQEKNGLPSLKSRANNSIEDNEFCAKINIDHSIYFIAHPHFKYRLHSGQESNELVQNDVYIRSVKRMNELYSTLGITLFSEELQEAFVKCAAAQYILEKDHLNLLKLVRDKKNYGRTVIGQLCLRMIFGEVTKIGPDQTHTNRDDPYSNMLRSIKQRRAVSRRIQQKKIVLIGSMLAAHFCYRYLTQSKASIIAVVDREVDRQGAMLFETEIVSYRSFFEEARSPSDYLFIITSESRNFGIVTHLRSYFREAIWIFWHDIFDKDAELNTSA